MKSKTFYATFFLFLAAIYLGIFILSVFSLRDTTRQAKEQTLNEQYFIAAALYGDMAAVDARGIAVEEELEQLLQPYLHLAGSRGAVLALYRDDLLLHATRTLSQQESPPSRTTWESRTVSLYKNDGRYFCSVIGALPQPFHRYSILYQTDATGPIGHWRQRNNLMLLTGGGLSLLLALALLLLLNRLFHPLAMITQQSRQIAQGNYAARLQEAGSDELAEMARSFNHMAGEVESKVTQLAAAAENRQRFVDNLAHELRTPLTAIYGYAEYMQKAALSEADRQFAVDAILSESRRMQSMSSLLLELSNLRTGDISMEKQSLPTLLDDVRRSLSARLSEKNIDLRCVSRAESVTGDRDLLQSLLVNLVDNAIKASNAGGTVTVRAFLREGLPVVQVEDQGKGMEPAQLAHITEPYYRVDKARSRKEGGAGLGLSICQMIVLRHGATMAFQSVPQKGTTVTVSFTTP